MYTEDYSALAGASAGIYLISLAFAVLAIVAMWKIFTKAGEPGWGAIVPFYNLYLLYKITWGSGWMFLTMLIPVANAVIAIITYFKLAKVFGKGAGFGVGLWLLNPIFMLILAFGDSSYQGVQ